LQGLDFLVPVADGGPGAFGHIVHPSITGTIITPPEVFSSDNTGFEDLNPGNEFGKQLIQLDTTTDQSIGNGFIAQAGLATVLLGEIMVDTTGFFSGSWSLTMNTAAGPTDIIAWGDVSNPFPPTDPAGSLFIDGSISVPEPTSVVLGMFAVAGLAIVAIRKRRAYGSA
jgi:hypothetical protein